MNREPRRTPPRRRRTSPDNGPLALLPLITGVIVAVVGAYTTTRSVIVTIVAAVLGVALAAWTALLHR
jgi:hypothetical protein